MLLWRKALFTNLTILLFCTVSVKAQQADFAASIKSGCFPLTVKFKDLSTGTGLTEWLWNFGNGNSSTLQEPSAVYTEPGVYSVSLKVSNASGSDSEVKTNFIVVFDEPKASFTFTIPPDQKCAPLTVNFTDQSLPGSGSISSWSWTFGDGGTQANKNPSYTYNSSGRYSVSLTVKNSFGCQSTVVGNSQIQVDGIEGSFTTPGNAFCSSPAAVQFTSEVNAPNVTYEWNFGDGFSGSDASPLHTYTEPGNFSVTMKVQDAAGCSDTFSKTITIGSESGADFTMSSSKICVGTQIDFERVVSGTILSQEWTFADGTTSNQNTVSKIFAAPGKQKVTFTASLSGKSCHSVITKEIEVVAEAKPDFTHTSACDGTVVFNNKSKDAVGYQWNFGDNKSSNDISPVHPYAAARSYTVQLKAFNELGCEKIVEKNIITFEKVQASFTPAGGQTCIGSSLTGCAPFAVTFQNTSVSPVAVTKTEWDFGDGTKSTASSPTHTFTKKGIYSVKLSITTMDGCESSFLAEARVADVSPTAKFVAPKTTVCPGEPIKFDDQSVNANFLCWNFGDGSTGSGNDPSHSYAKPGKYTVSLTAKNEGCTSSFTLAEQITVLAPLVEFAVTKTCEEPFKVTLLNGSADYDEIEWTFGDGTLPTLEVNHTYAATGQYAVQLTAKNHNTQCSVSMSQTVIIQDVKADFVGDNAKPCLNEPVRFSDQSQAATRWQWIFGDGEISQLKNPEKPFSTPGRYAVQLTVTDSEGCRDTKLINEYISVVGIQAAFEVDAASNCDALIVDFTDRSIANPPIASWDWDFGDGSASSKKNPTHAYTEVGEFTIRLNLESAEGNCTIIREDLIDFRRPVPDFSLKKPGFCIGESIELVNNSIDATKFLWTVNGVPVSLDHSPIVLMNSAGSFDVGLSATDDLGCTQTTNKNSFIEITKPQTDFEISQTSAECPPLIANFQDKSTGLGIKAWNWDFGDNQKSQLRNPTNTYTRPGAFDVTLVVTDKNGCKSEAKKSSVVSVGGPYGTYSLSDTEICIGETITAAVQSENTAFHRWDFGDGTVVDDVGSSIEHKYNHAASFIVNLVFVDHKNCKVIADRAFTVRVSGLPQAEFTYEPKHPFENEPVSLYGIQDSFVHQWREGSVVLSNDKDTDVVLTAGSHDITLIVTNDFGCSAEVTQTIRVQGDLTFIPNVFTPNNDQYNNSFEIPGVENGLWYLQVFNRWGRLVYESKEYDGNWIAEREAAGIYYYYIYNVTRPEKAYKGWVHVVK